MVPENINKPDSISPHPEIPASSGRPAITGWVIGLLIAGLVVYLAVRPRQQTASAVVVSTSASATVPGSPTAKYLTESLQHYQAGRYREAIEAGKQVLAIDPKSAEAYNNIAVSYISLHMPNEAFQNIQEALRLKPDFQLAQNNRSWILREMGQGGPASAQGQTGGPKTAEAFLEESVQLNQAGRYADSIAAAMEAIKLKPNMAEAYNNVAAGYASLHRWDEALPAAQKAVQLKPDFQLAKNNLAWILSEKQKQTPASRSKPLVGCAGNSPGRLGAMRVALRVAGVLKSGHRERSPRVNAGGVSDDRLFDDRPVVLRPSVKPSSASLPRDGPSTRRAASPWH